MDDWKSSLTADPTEWLLESSEPSVHYFALRHILDRPEDDPEVIAARQHIMQDRIITEMLVKQRESAYIAAYPRFYTYKYKDMYQTDILEILDIMTGLGICDDRMDDVVGIIAGKQDEDGKWRIENTYCSERLLVPMGKKGEQSKWLTLKAMRVLKRYYLMSV